jgi:hypothetical protein
MKELLKQLHLNLEDRVIAQVLPQENEQVISMLKSDGAKKGNSSSNGWRGI